MAVLVAGYEEAQTSNAATYLVNLQNIGFRFEETEKILVFLYQNPDSKNLWDF